MSRFENSKKNLIYALIGQVLAIFTAFIGRMVFLTFLNAEYLGLNALFSNIIKVLSLADLGIGSAIIYSLYSPLAKKDWFSVGSIMYLFKKIYILIGLVIFVLGVGFLPFIYFFIQDSPEINLIEVIFILFVINSSMTYFLSYKRTLLIADQKQYVDVFYKYTFLTLLNLVQIIILFLTRNYILFLSIQIVFTILENIVISIKINKIYPIFKKLNYESLDKNAKKQIIHNTSAMVSHKVGGLVVNSTDNIIISKFISLVTVGIYSNYLMIFQAINTISSQVFVALTASIGNLATTNDLKKLHNIYDKVLFLNYLVYSFVSITIYILIDRFIIIWLGSSNLLDINVLLVLVINFYISGMRRTTLVFRDALGLFWKDRFKPIFEAVLNIIFSLILVRFFGLIGVFLGTLISTLLTSFWIEPYILFKYGFKESLYQYFITYLIYTLFTIFVGLVTFYITSLVNTYEIIDFIYILLMSVSITNLSNFLIFSRSSKMKYIIFLIKNSFFKKQKGPQDKINSWKF